MSIHREIKCSDHSDIYMVSAQNIYISGHYTAKTNKTYMQRYPWLWQFMCQHCCSKVITLNIQSKIKFIHKLPIARFLDLNK
jgi:hypothetical protein